MWNLTNKQKKKSMYVLMLLMLLKCRFSAREKELMMSINKNFSSINRFRKFKLLKVLSFRVWRELLSILMPIKYTLSAVYRIHSAIDEISIKCFYVVRKTISHYALSSSNNGSQRQTIIFIALILNLPSTHFSLVVSLLTRSIRVD